MSSSSPETVPSTGSAGVEPPAAAPPTAPAARRPGARLGPGLLLFFRVMRANPLTFAGFVLVVLIVGTATLVEVVPFLTNLVLGHAIQLYPYDPNSANAAGTFLPPSPQHWMGTDLVGQDIFSRVLAALPIDLFIGITIAGGSLVVGGGLGLVAGFWDAPRSAGGFLSVGILRVTDVFLSFPSLVLALAIAASLGRGTYPSMLAVFATWWPFYVRLTRGEVLVIKQQPYITAARAAGVSEGRILVRHVLRNLIEPLAVYFTLDIGTVIVTYSTISFIGVGVPASVPEWGNMIERYQDFLVTQPYMIGFVALAIFVTVLAFSLLGDGLRDLLDPRSRRVLAGVAVTRGGGAPTTAVGPLVGAAPEGEEP
jgi:peptide/nickel transport system permease protein